VRRFAVAAEQRVVRGKNPDLTAALGQPLELARLRLAGAQAGPECLRLNILTLGSGLPDGGRSIALAGQVMNLISGAIGFKVSGLGGGVAAYGARIGQRRLRAG
jgi:hypothetical protein